MPTGGPSSRAGFAYATHVGLARNRDQGVTCLELRNPGARAGQRVALVATAGALVPRESRLVIAAVRDVGGRECASGAPAPEPGHSVYRLSVLSGSLETGAGYVAVLDPPPAMVVDQNGVTGDLDGDGIAEVFRECASHEGVHYSVWSGARGPATRRWHAYDYVGYDLEPTCDELDYQGLPK